MISASHKDLLVKSAVTDVVAAGAGIRSVAVKEDLPECYGYLNGKGVPGLLFTWYSAAGDEVPQYRPDAPVMNGSGKLAKYLWPTGKPPVFQVLPSQRPLLADVDRTIVLVEGTKQCLAAVSAANGSADWVVLGMVGCYGWSSDGKPSPDMGHVPWAGRDVVLVLDADWMTNPQVWQAASDVTVVLDTLYGAKSVRYAQLPMGGKAGLDDVLAVAPDKGATFKRIVDKATTKLGKRPQPPGNEWMDGNEVLAAAAAAEVRKRVPVLLNREKRVVAYTHGVFKNELERVRGVVGTMLMDRYTPSRANTVVEFLLNELVKDQALLPERAEDRLINVQNGMLDPVTLELKKHDPMYKSRFQFPVRWDPEAKCPVFDEWVVGAAGDQVADLEEVASQMLDQTRTPTKAVFLYGPSRSGKSTYLRMLERVAGKENCAGLTLHQVMEDRFAAANLYGALLNSAAELSARHVEDVSVFKTLLGEDTIQANRKYGGQFFFVNQAMFVFSMNTIPSVGESSRAYLERVKPFRFGNSFAGAEDPAIEDRMCGELEGIFRRLVEAFGRRLKRGGFAPTDSDVADDFSESSDRVRQWMKERCVWVVKPMGTAGTDLHADFKVWAAQNEFRSLGRNRFYDRMASAGVERFENTLGQTAFRLVLKKPGAVILGGNSAKTQVTTYVSADSTASAPYPPSIENTPSTSTTSSSLSLRGEEGVERVETQVVTYPSGGDSSDVPTTDPPVWLLQPGVFTLDLETPSADDLFTGDYEGPFVRLAGFRGPHGDVETQVSPATTAHWLRQMLKVDGVELLTHNGWAYDLVALAHHLDLPYEALMERTRDLRVEAFLASPPTTTKGAKREHYDLATLGATYAGVAKSKALDSLKREFGGYDKIPVDEPRYHEYLRKDLEVTAALSASFTVPDAEYYKMERRVATIAGRLSLTGLRIDEDLLAARLARLSADKESGRKRLVEEFGFPSLTAAGAPSKQPYALKGATDVFDKLIPGGWPWPRSDSGKQASTASDTMLEVVEEYGADSPAGQVARIVHDMQAGNSFVAQTSKNLVGGRVHPSYGIITATGRWSSKKPNIMGVGKRTSVLLEDRDFILAEPGEVFVSVDLSGIDARCVAGLSGDAAYAELFLPGVDIHNEMALMFFGDVGMRDPAKAVSHGINYGRGPRAIAAQTGRPVEEVEALHRKYFERFPGIAEWHTRVRHIGSAGGILDTGTGRLVRTDPAIAYTEAPARLAQAAARDLTMRGMLAVMDEGLLSMLRIFIHDEVVLSVPEDRAEEVAEQVAELMSFTWESPSGLVLPIVAEPGKGSGPRWSDCYKRKAS